METVHAPQPLLNRSRPPGPRAGVRAPLLTALALACAALLSGCTASAASAAGGGVAAARPGVHDQAQGSFSSADRTAAETSAGVLSGSTATDRSVTVIGDLALRAADPVSAARSIAALVAAAGGRVQTQDEHPSARNASADLTVRIPSSAFPATLGAIERRGKVVSVSVRSADVTSRVTDYGVRIAGLRTSITRLQALLARSTTTTDLVRIESSLTDRQTDLEQLLAEQKALSDQVAFSTLTITVQAPDVPPRTAPSTFVSGFAAGVAALGATLGWMFVALGVLLPWLVVLAVVGVVALAVRRLVRRARHPAAI